MKTQLVSSFGSLRRLATAGALVGLAMSLPGGCKAVSIFTCNTDEMCAEHGEGGVCETNNYCSFPDETCLATGRRWHARAGEMGGDCIEPESAATDTDATGSDGSGTEGDDGDQDTSTGNGTAPMTTAESTGMPDPVTTDPGESTGAPTTGEPATCADQFGGATDFLLCTEDDTSCMFSVTLMMVMSCNDVCTSFGGTCLEAHTNDADLCTPTAPTTCDDAASNDGICVCSKA